MVDVAGGFWFVRRLGGSVERGGVSRVFFYSVASFYDISCDTSVSFSATVHFYSGSWEISFVLFYSFHFLLGWM